jgi:hypothetical protein
MIDEVGTLMTTLIVVIWSLWGSWRRVQGIGHLRVSFGLVRGFGEVLKMACGVHATSISFSGSRGGGVA